MAGPGLRGKIVIWTFVPTAMTLLIVSLVTFLAYERVTADLVIERDRELIRLAAGQLAVELSEYSQLLHEEARTVTYQLNMEKPDDLQVALSQSRNRTIVFDAGIVVLDNFGHVLAADPAQPALLGQDWSTQSHIRRMLLTPGTIFSDVTEMGPGQQPMMAVSVPVISPRREFLGILVGLFHVNTNSVNSFYGDIVKLRLNREGSAYLVDSQGRVIYHSDSHYIGDNFANQPVVQAVISGQTDARRTQDFDGRVIVAGYAPVPGTPWGLVTEEPWATLVRPSQGYRQFLMALLALGIVGPTLFVAFSVRRITQPIEELIAATKAVAAGNFDQEIKAESGDEIAALAQQFNHMSAQLRTSYAEIERKVQERTRELSVLYQTARVLSHSLRMETMLSIALERVLEELNFDAGAIFLYDSVRGQLELITQQGLSERFQQEASQGIIAKATVDTGDLVMIEDLAQDGRIPANLLAEGHRSLMSIPLYSQRRIQGVLTICSSQPRPMGSNDKDLLRSIGNQMGVAMENALLYSTEQRRSEQFRVLGEVGRSITSIMAQDELLKRLTQLLQESFDYYHVGIGLIEKDELVYKFGAGKLWDAPNFDFHPNGFQLGWQGLSGWVAGHGQALILPDVSQDPRYVHLEPSQTRSEAVLPIRVKSQVIGVLDVQQDRLNAFDETEITVLQSLANQAGIAIENARLYEQAAQLAVLEERQRLARDLHDSVTQGLYGITMYAEAAARLLQSGESETAATYLQDLAETAQGALAEMRLLIYELRPSMLESAGLAAAIQHRLATVEGRSGLHAETQISEVGALPKQMEEELYWISQEVLNNVIKHAKADRVSVTLQRVGDQISMQIWDDGSGFDPVAAREAGGLGLRGISERAALLNGRVQIESAPGQGSTVRIQIPIR